MADPLKTDLFADLFAAIRVGEKRIKVNGLSGSSEAFFLAGLLHEGIPFCLVTPSLSDAQQMYDEIAFFSGVATATPNTPATLGPALSQTSSLLPRPTGAVCPLPPVRLFPPLDLLPGEQSDARPDWVAARLSLLYKLATGAPISIVTPVEAFLHPVPDQSFFHAKIFKQGDTVDRDPLLKSLDQDAYNRVDCVTQAGEYAVRGGIMDLYSPVEPHPVRIELFGDTIRSLRAFDPASQRSLETVPSVCIIPSRENSSPSVSLIDYLPQDIPVIYDEPDAVALHAKRLKQENDLIPVRETGVVLDLEALSIGSARGAKRFSFEITPQSSLSVERLGFSDVIQKLQVLRLDHLIVVVARNPIQTDRLKRLLADYETPESVIEAGWASLARPAPILLAIGNISEGFLLPQEKIVFLTDEALFGHPGKKRLLHETPDHRSLLLGSLEDLKPHDYVVHVEHGIGQYMGLKRIAVSLDWRGRDKYEADFLELRYAGGNRLYVPLTSLKLISKYIGPEGAHPALDTLGGTRWARTKEKVKKAICEMTGELLTLYAERRVVEGHSFQPTPHLDEFAAGFEYEETPDQLRAICAVIEDMQGTKPMDRLICGDVGYGKTEVAMRGAFLAIMDNKQVAVAVPTTLLALQHGATFTKRFAPFPVKIAVLSRFSSRKEQAEIIHGLKNGTTDIVIGTHRLFQKDVSFSNLGLVIMDEEQRFGVRHKERLKQMRKEVDVLTLTATPIPRTLQMALAQIRDMTVIQSPPVNRLSIRTQLAPFDPPFIREIIFRELVRGGQVFFVHNRVHDIETIGTFLADLVPEAKICIAHGQMGAGMLEGVMMGFLAKKYNVLLTTTIIESGLDIPSANTLIINNADSFGLAEMYQLRGRVGRSDVQAYAYLLVHEEKILTTAARERLQTITEFTELGDGFKIAARDLEIRGAGDLLGAEQSGQVAAVGFDLYLKMIDETVREMKGTPVEKEIETQIQLRCSSYIPEEYISDAYQRLTLYRRLSTVQTLSEVDGLHEEIVDRYGPMPDPVTHLFNIVKLKKQAVASRVVKIVEEEDTALFYLDESAGVSETAVHRLLDSYKNRIRFLSPFSFKLDRIGSGSKRPSKRVPPAGKSEETVFEEISSCLAVLQGEQQARPSHRGRND